MSVDLVVLPGDRIAAEAGYLRGHGTYVSPAGDGDSGGPPALRANVAGLVERVNKLVTVRPLHTRYYGDVGDIVVGRVREVGSKRWRVDVGARQDGVLMLSALHLEGGEQRRRTFEDALNMREVLAEGDLVSAEVYTVMADGCLQLHARSAKYGRLANGVLVTVPPSLMRRLKQHVVPLPCGVEAILGMNGHIWLTATHAPPVAAAAGGAGEGGGGGAGEGGAASPPAAAPGSSGGGGGDAAVGHAPLDDVAAASVGLVGAIERRKELAHSRVIQPAERAAVARVHNAIAALRARALAISPESIMDVYRDSEDAGVAAADMLASLEAVTATAWAKAARQQQQLG